MQHRRTISQSNVGHHVTRGEVPGWREERVVSGRGERRVVSGRGERRVVSDRGERRVEISGKRENRQVICYKL